MLTVTQDMHATIGDMQHHDAVTGTSPKNVVSTYLRQLSDSIDTTSPVFAQTVSDFMQDSGITTGKNSSWTQL
jgi:hypothetical protein